MANDLPDEESEPDRESKVERRTLRAANELFLKLLQAEADRQKLGREEEPNK